MVFNHSVKVPTQYRRAATTFRKVIEEKKSVKSILYEERHAKIPNLLALLSKYSNNKDIIETIIKKSSILKENPRLNEYLCRVLVTELIYGRKSLIGESKPVLCVLSYKDKFEEIANRHQNRSTNDSTSVENSKGRKNLLQQSVEETEEQEHVQSGANTCNNGNESELSTYLWLLFFSMLMFTVPFLTFFGVKNWLQDSYNIDGFNNTCYSVLASVLIVNFILFLYVLKAFYENDNVLSKKPRYIRINTNLTSLNEVESFLLEEEWKKNTKIFNSYDEYLRAIQNMAEDEYIQDIHIPTILVFHQKWKNYWAQHDYVMQKKFLLQDKATCLVGELLNPPENATVLDMCAAPGMKTIHLSNILKNKGKIYAIEQDDQRYQVLCNMLKEAAAKTVKTINADALAIRDEDVPGVEYILVDPSCSGSGMKRITLDKEEDFENSNRLTQLSKFQFKLLDYAMTAFPKVKRIAYSTCSLYEEENEQVVQSCMQKHPEFKLLNCKKSLRGRWKNMASKSYKSIGKNCIYSIPEDDLTDGMFIAIFEKTM